MNIQLNGLVFKQRLRDLAKLVHEKTCVIPMFKMYKCLIYIFSNTRFIDAYIREAGRFSCGTSIVWDSCGAKNAQCLCLSEVITEKQYHADQSVTLVVLSVHEHLQTQKYASHAFLMGKISVTHSLIHQI